MSSDARPDSRANLGILAYSVGLTLVGIGIAVGAYLFDWGFMGYFGGGLLVVAGGAMLVTRLRGGLKYVSITCPRCQHEQTYAEEALDSSRVVPCKGCFEYMERGAAGVAPVPDDRVAADPLFEAPYPATGLSFDGTCVLCGVPATENEEVEGSNVRVGIAVSQRITRTIQVPVCPEHRAQRAVELGAGVYFDGLDAFAVRFRSYAQRRRFRAANPAPMKVSAASVTFGRG